MKNNNTYIQRNKIKKYCTSYEKVAGFLTGRFEMDKPAKGFVFDNYKLAFTTKENFNGADDEELWKSEKEVYNL